jgi:Tol biopolymer transport system component
MIWLTRKRASLLLAIVLGVLTLAILWTGDFQVDVDWLINKPASQEAGLARPSATPTFISTATATITPTQTPGDDSDPNATPSATPIPSLFESSEVGGSFGGSGRIAFVSDRDGNPEIYTLDFSTGQISRLTYSDMADFHPRWSSDGRLIAFTSYRDGGPDIHTITSTGALRRSLTDSEWFDEFPSWSPDGDWILFDSNRSEAGGSSPSEAFRLYLMRSDGSEAHRVLSDAVDGAVGSYSPDGDLIVFQSQAEGGVYQIYTLDQGTNRITRLTHTLARNFRPSWSPDGQRIVFVSERDGQAELYVMNADGTEQRRLTQGNLGHVRGPAWSPDGAWILFNAEVDGNTDLYVIDLTGTQLYRLTEHPTDDYHPDWRPGQP